MPRPALTEQVLIHSKVANYMEFKPVEGSFVYRSGKTGGKVYKVPITPKEAMKSPLLGMVEKARMAQFTAWVAAVKTDKPGDKSWSAGGMSSTKLQLNTMTGVYLPNLAHPIPHTPSRAPSS